MEDDVDFGIVEMFVCLFVVFGYLDVPVLL